LDSLLAATEPAGNATLGLCGTLLDLFVELVDGLDGLSASLLGVGLGVALGSTSLLVGLTPLMS
jgi:hypothetical protein